MAINSVYRVLRDSADKLGFHLVLRRKTGSIDYDFLELLVSYGTFASSSPWNSDVLFNETYDRIKAHTLVDKNRCYELWQLVHEAKKTEGVIIEVGVWRGGTGAIIAKQAKLKGIRDRVYLCDTFRGVVKAGANDPLYKGGEHADTSKQMVEALFRKLRLDNIQILEGVFPDETGRLISDKKFRFCHIDVDVYQSSKDILEWLWPRLSMGGMVVFDDYGFRNCAGIKQLVDEQRIRQDRVVVSNTSGHAILIKISS